MIKSIKRPHDFDHLPVILTCFEFVDANGTYMVMGVQIVENTSALHVEMKRWTHNVARQLKKDFEHFIRDYLKPKGITQMVASYPEAGNKTWAKFIKMFGFPEPKSVLISTKEI